MAFNGPIFMIQTARPTISNLPVLLQWFMKGSGASEYLQIGPNFDLKEHYNPKGDGHFNQIGSDPFANRNPFI